MVDDEQWTVDDGHNIKSLTIELTQALENLPSPLFAKEG